jgi:hypothetical protein
MGTDARWQMLLKQNFHRQVSGRHPCAKDGERRCSRAWPWSAWISAVWGFTKAAMGLTTTNTALVKLQRQQAERRPREAGEAALLLRPDNGTASNHYGESGSGPCPREERRPKSPRSAGRVQAICAAPIVADGGIGGPRPLPRLLAGREECPRANRHTHSPHRSRALVLFPG